jgi:hyperosmotically inducible protein
MKATSMKLSAFTLVCLIGLTACDNSNTGEDTGKKIDQAVANAEVKMGEASENMGEASDKAGDNVEDAAITTKIKAAFLAESDIKSMDINVTTKDDVVTLTGSTDSLASSKKAEEIARGVSDVKQVNNQLIIK